MAAGLTLQLQRTPACFLQTLIVKVFILYVRTTYLFIIIAEHKLFECCLLRGINK